MPPPNDFRPQVFRNPYMPRRGGNPIRGFSQSQQRGNTAFEPTYAMPSPQDAAMGLFNIGLQADSSGNLNPTQDFGGMMGAASSQINSLSRGIRPGQFSSLGKPMGTMYAQNPGFFKSGPGGTAAFGDAVSQRNQSMRQGGGIPNPLVNNAQGYQGSSEVTNDLVYRPTTAPLMERLTQGVNLGTAQSGQGTGDATLMRPGYAGPYRPGLTGTTEQQKIQNRASLQEQVDAKRMLGQATGDIPTVTYKTGFGTDYSPERQAAMASGEVPIGPRDKVTISGKYGTGSSTFSAPGTPRKEGLINGKPASEVLQGLANKPGIARAGDRFQPQKSTPAETKAMNTALSKLPMRNPLLKR